MPSTAGDMVEAAQINFGRAKDERATLLLEAWLNSGSRDWRRESGEGVPDGDTVISVVFAEPAKAQNLRMQVAQNVKRWGFLRRGHHQGNLKFLTIEKYMEDPPGELVLRRARDLIAKGVKKQQERADFIARIRSERLREKLAEFRAKQQQRHSLVLKGRLKSLWDVASNRIRKDLLDKNKGFRDDPVVRRRRMGRGVEYERLDEYKEDGEPDWEVQDKKRRLHVTVQM